MKSLVFFRCPHCGNIIVKTTDSGVPVVCCGEPMQVLTPHTEEAGHEKHLPVVEHTCKIASQDCSLVVHIGSMPHPMTPEHHIEWVCLENQQGFQLVRLSTQDPPRVEFCSCKDKPVAVYEYCNIHGLWVTPIK